ncbi:MAG: PKD domain-containing protein, partial [Marinirhabdus sp.]
IEMLSDYSTVGDQVVAKLSEATIQLNDIQPAPGVEGTNYSSNVGLSDIVSPGILENAIKNNFALIAQSELTKIGDVQETVPSVSQIENFIEQEIRKELNTRKEILIWEPAPPSDTEVEISINDVTPQALNEGMAIAINNTGSGNPGAITFFVPNNRSFATAISKAEVISQMREARDETFGSLPTRLDPVEGKDVDLNNLDFKLKSGAIEASGDVTVIDAILGSIDVDANFSADIGMEWVDGDEGMQKINPFEIGEPDVDLSLLAWILSFLFGFITGGIIGVIIVAVVLSIVENIAERIGAAVVRDEVSGQVKEIGAWPQTLSNIGTVSARFENPINIDSDGIMFSGNIFVTSTHELTSEDFALSNGPYFNVGGQSLNFDGGLEKATSETLWDFDDGNMSIIRKPAHVYGKSGLYIAKLRVAVTEEGGVTTRHFAKVKVQNVAPQVFMPPTITANEGEEVPITATFTDANWLDTHTASIDWGDNSPPQELIVVQTNEEPQAQGEVFACHAYCDDGTYEVKLTVRDNVGGIGVGTVNVIVQNVAPNVFLPNKIMTLKDQCVHFTGEFEDVGWCDKHTGIWDMGDCRSRDAVITETNEKPKAIGTAKVRHVYKNCGTHKAKLTITDDDGGVGEATMCVGVNHLKNGDFEKGFYNLKIREGHEDIIANHWLPFATLVDTIDRAAITGQRSVDFDPQQYVISDGQRSQRIYVQGAMQAGIMQQIEVNEGWDYEFTGHFHIPVFSTAKAIIGIDPLGKGDPNSSSVVWKEVGLNLQWKNGKSYR